MLSLAGERLNLANVKLILDIGFSLATFTLQCTEQFSTDFDKKEGAGREYACARSQ
jgi:hypothetical protein